MIQFELFQETFRRFILSWLTNVPLNSIHFFDSFFGVKEKWSLIALCFSLSNFWSFLSFSSRFFDVSSDSTVFSRKIVVLLPLQQIAEKNRLFSCPPLTFSEVQCQSCFKLICHDKSCIKTCQREHVNNYSLHFLYAKRRTKLFWFF